jgi:hypothetical protein
MKGKEIKISLQQTMEAHRVLRRRGSHIFWTIGSQMDVRLSLVRQPPSTSHKDSWYSFLLEAESTSGS